jgi:hypothetical protein
MLRTKLVWLTCLAVALSGPAIARDDHGGKGGTSTSQSGKGDGDGDGKGSGSQSGKGDGNGGGGSQSGKGDGNGGGQSGSGSGNGGGTQSGPGSSSGKGDGGANPGQPALRTDVRLAATAQGAGFEGNVDIRAQGNEQRLKVEIEVGPDVADGTVFTVMANGVAVGTITIHLHEGELELDLRDGAMLPQGLAAGDITTIQVMRADGVTVLQAVFASLNSGTPPVTPPPVGGVVKNEADLRGSVDPAAGVVDGEAQLRVQGAQQQLKVEVNASLVPDGTVMTVTANIMGTTVTLGTATFRLNEAEFKLDNSGVLPVGLTSLSDISSISVSAPGFFTLMGSLP